MKYSISIQLHPVVVVLLILLALIGIDAFWMRQRHSKRATSQHVRPTATSNRMPPSSRPPAPMDEPITPAPGTVTVERDEKPRSPFGSRKASRPIRPDVQDRVSQKIADMNAQVKQAAMNGANAYVRQQQPT